MPVKIAYKTQQAQLTCKVPWFADVARSLLVGNGAGGDISRIMACSYQHTCRAHYVTPRISRTWSRGTRTDVICAVTSRYCRLPSIRSRDRCNDGWAQAILLKPTKLHYKSTPSGSRAAHIEDKRHTHGYRICRNLGDFVEMPSIRSKDRCNDG